MAKRRSFVLVAVVFIVLLSGALVLWRTHETRAKAARVEAQILKGLTAEEIGLVLRSQAASDLPGVHAIIETVETRKSFLKAIEQHLALAAEARREGLHENPNFKINLAYKKRLLLADIYAAWLSKGLSKYVISREEIDAIWKDSQNETAFSRDMEALRTIQLEVARERGDQLSIGRLQGESLAKARVNWARAKILSSKANSDSEFIARPEIQLRYRILEAGILSTDYLRQHWDRIRATPAEIAAYLAAHPEYDLNKKREQALSLLQRARSGEDFGKLVSEYSEDRASKERGGLYEKVTSGTIWSEVEQATLTLRTGEVSAYLVETELGYHIVKLQDKTITDGGKNIEFSFRQILLQKSFPEPGGTKLGIPPPFMKADEIAKAQIENQKRSRFVEAIVQRNQISLPPDFAVALN